MSSKNNKLIQFSFIVRKFMLQLSYDNFHKLIWQSWWRDSVINFQLEFHCLSFFSSSSCSWNGRRWRFIFRKLLKMRETKEDEEKKEEIKKLLSISTSPFLIMFIFFLNFQLRRTRNLMKRVSGTLSHSGWLLFLSFAHVWCVGEGSVIVDKNNYPEFFHCDRWHRTRAKKISTGDSVLWFSMAWALLPLSPPLPLNCSFVI